MTTRMSAWLRHIGAAIDSPTLALMTLVIFILETKGHFVSRTHSQPQPRRCLPSRTCVSGVDACGSSRSKMNSAVLANGTRISCVTSPNVKLKGVASAVDCTIEAPTKTKQDRQDKQQATRQQHSRPRVASARLLAFM